MPASADRRAPRRSLAAMEPSGRPLEVTIEITAGALVCRLTGELDARTAPHLRAAVADLAAAPRVVVDLGGVPFIDSAGLGALIGLIRRVRDAGGIVAVTLGREPVRRLLRVAGLDRVAPLTASIDEAIAEITRVADRTPVA
jgi:anti-sigma B factor antagonist